MEEHQEEFYEEPLEDGTGTARRPATRWRNPTGAPVRMSIFIEGPRLVDPTAHKYRPSRYLEVTIPPGGEAVIPSYLDHGVQQTQCTDPACAQRPLHCTDPTHYKMIVGGLGMQLVRVGARIAPTPPEIHPAMQPPRASIAPASLDERLMARARSQGAR